MTRLAVLVGAIAATVSNVSVVVVAQSRFVNGVPYCGGGDPATTRAFVRASVAASEAYIKQDLATYARHVREERHVLREEIMMETRCLGSGRVSSGTIQVLRNNRAAAYSELADADAALGDRSAAKADYKRSIADTVYMCVHFDRFIAASMVGILKDAFASRPALFEGSLALGACATPAPESTAPSVPPSPMSSLPLQ